MAVYNYNGFSKDVLLKGIPEGGSYIIKNEELKKDALGVNVGISVLWDRPPQPSIKLNVHLGSKVGSGFFGYSKGSGTGLIASFKKRHHFNDVIKPIVFKLIDLGLDNYNDFEAYKMYEYPTEVKGSDFRLAIKCLRNLKKNNASLTKDGY